jgi:hypothetical protein
MLMQGPYFLCCSLPHQKSFFVKEHNHVIYFLGHFSTTMPINDSLSIFHNSLSIHNHLLSSHTKPNTYINWHKILQMLGHCRYTISNGDLPVTPFSSIVVCKFCLCKGIIPLFCLVSITAPYQFSMCSI